MTPWRALSLTRPWPYTILHLGKGIENRSHGQFSRFRGPLLLHAALSWDDGVGAWCVERGLMPPLALTKPDAGVMFNSGKWAARRYGRGARTDYHPTGIVGRCNVVGSIAPWTGGIQLPPMEHPQVTFLHDVRRPLHCHHVAGWDADRVACVILDGISIAERAAFNRALDMRWWMGGHALVLADVVALAHPIPCKGRLGLWRPPADVLAQALTQSAKDQAGIA